MKMSFNKKGFSIIEIVIASAIITTAGMFIIISIQAYINVSSKNSKLIQTALLFEETAEVLQYMRDTSWSSNIENLNLNTDYYLHWNGSSYSVTSTPNLYQNLYTRKFELNSIERDAGDNITTSGTNDPDTLKAIIKVSWPDKSTTTEKQTEILIHNVYDN